MINAHDSVVMYETSDNLRGFGFILFAETKNAIEVWTAINPNMQELSFKWLFRGLLIIGDDFDKTISGQISFNDLVNSSLFPVCIADIEKTTRNNEWGFKVVKNIVKKLQMDWFHNRFHSEITFIANKTQNQSIKTILQKILKGGTLPEGDAV